MTTQSVGKKLTAAQIILQAADDLVNSGLSEFTEFELTVSAWRRDSERFGLRGYNDKHPDHKRVMMEIMGQKPHNPIHLGFMEKVKPNVYRMTSTGRLEADRLRHLPAGAKATTPKSTPVVKAPVAAPVVKEIQIAKPLKAAATPDGLYDQIHDYVFHSAFGAWKDDPEEPSKWASAEAFFNGRKGGQSLDPADRLAEIDAAAKAACDYCEANDLSFLAPGAKGTRRISAADLGRLRDFLKALGYRFTNELKLKPRKPVKA